MTRLERLEQAGVKAWCSLPGWVRDEAPLPVQEVMARRLALLIAAELGVAIAKALLMQRALADLTASCQKATRELRAFTAADRKLRALRAAVPRLLTTPLSDVELAALRRRGPGRVH